MDVHDQILLFIKANGPTTPTKVAKVIKQESLFASALLADLASHRKIRISHLKIGGSPLYYLPEQEEQLYKFTQGNINPKDHEVLERLKAEKILRESSLELLPKVALRGLKDFAIPLQVTTGQGTELFWKWHLLSKEEANQIIGNILNPKANEPEKLEEVRPISEAPTPQTVQEVMTQQAPLAQEKNQEKTQEEQEIPTVEAQVVEEENEKEPREKEEQKEEKVKEKDVPKIADLQKEHDEKKPVKEEKEEPESENEKNEIEESPTEHKEEQTHLHERKPLIERLREKISSKRKEAPDRLLEMITPNFEEDKLEIISYEVVRKNSEIDLILMVPTVVGKAKFFCKAKKKARLDDKDIAAAYLEAQAKKLPLLMVYTGTISKKAQEMLDQENFVNLCMRKIE